MPKVTISPAQALLKLIAHYRTHANTQEERNYLEHLIHIYLDGTVNPDWRMHYNNFVSYHENDVLKSYTISTDPEVIDNDPTRRYFETHLSLESIKSTVQALPQERLNYFYWELCKMLMQLDTPSFTEAMQVLAGAVPDDNNELYKEYASYIERISNGTVFTNEQGFAPDDREVLHRIVSCAFLSVKCAQSNAVNQILPLNVYGSDSQCFGYFGTERGKQLKDKAQNKGLSHHYGLLKGHMPVSITDDAYSTDCFPFLKSSEQANYDPGAIWVDSNFYHLVHPFSNSISGTMLCILRSLSFFQNEGINIFTDSAEDFKNFTRLFASTIVYYSGGHSLHEVLSVLRLQEIINEVQHRHNLSYLELDRAFISQLYLGDNRAAFDRALDKSIAYNEQYLQHCQLNKQIHHGVILRATEPHEKNGLVVIDRCPDNDMPPEPTALHPDRFFTPADAFMGEAEVQSRNVDDVSRKRNIDTVSRGVDEKSPEESTNPKKQVRVERVIEVENEQNFPYSSIISK